MFIAALLTVTKQPNCPLTDEYINEMWYIHIMEYYPVVRRNEILICAITWSGLENIMLN